MPKRKNTAPPDSNLQEEKEEISLDPSDLLPAYLDLCTNPASFDFPEPFLLGLSPTPDDAFEESQIAHFQQEEEATFDHPPIPRFDTENTAKRSKKSTASTAETPLLENTKRAEKKADWEAFMKRSLQEKQPQKSPTELNTLYSTYAEGDLNLYEGDTMIPAPRLDRYTAMVLCRQVEKLREAIKKGALSYKDINRQAFRGRRSLLSLAIDLHDFEIADMLLIEGVIIDRACNTHSTIALRATQTENADLVKAVLKHAKTLEVMPIIRATVNTGQNKSLLGQLVKTFRGNLPVLKEILDILLIKTPYSRLTKEKQKVGLLISAAELIADPMLLNALYEVEWTHWKEKQPNKASIHHAELETMREFIDPTLHCDTTGALITNAVQDEKQAETLPEEGGEILPPHTIQNAIQRITQNYLGGQKEMWNNPVVVQIWQNAIYNMCLSPPPYDVAEERKIHLLSCAFQQNLQAVLHKHFPLYPATQAERSHTSSPPPHCAFFQPEPTTTHQATHPTTQLDHYKKG